MKITKVTAGLLGTAALATLLVCGIVPALSQPDNTQHGAKAAGHADTAKAVHSLDEADLSAWLDGYVPYALKSGDIAGMVVVVVKDGKVLVQRGYGYADVAAKVPMDPGASMVRAGSTSKLFTWTAVMQLVEQGKVDLDKDINTYLDFKVDSKNGSAITMRDLMNHRAGFEEGLKDILAYDPKDFQTTERYLKDHPRPTLFNPGEVPAYSNYGAALAGYIVQRVSGESYENYVDRHIFQPLGMTHSTMIGPLPEQFRKFAAKGYATASDEPSREELVVTAPAGSASVTAVDMGKFMLAHLGQGQLNGAAILSPATTALMHSPTEKSLPGFSTMSHGMFHMNKNGRVVIGHGGDTIVFHSELDMLPQEGVGIFYSFNSRGRDSAVYGARQQLFDGFMDRYFPAPEAADVELVLPRAKADAAKIAGRYVSSRRIDHGFLRAFSLLQQDVIVDNGDGTITAPGGPVSPPAKFAEVAPNVWRKIGGAEQLALVEQGGIKTIVSSEDPVSVLQEVPRAQSGSLFTAIFVGSFAVLALTLLLWPLGALLAKANRATSGSGAEVRRLKLIQRGAALFDAVYLFGWYKLVEPILRTDFGPYVSANDGFVRLLQVGGMGAVAAAAAGLWSAWRMFRTDASQMTRAWGLLVAAALAGVVWVAYAGDLLSWNLNY